MATLLFFLFVLTWLSFIKTQLHFLFLLFLPPSSIVKSGSGLGRTDSPGYSYRGSQVSRPTSERSDSGVGMTTPRSASSPRGALDEASGGGNPGPEKNHFHSHFRSTIVFLSRFFFVTKLSLILLLISTF